jgi:hypothetical protein
MLKYLFTLSALYALVAADCYMQNPRGSNDRNNEANTNRNNGNRLFDSQNNAKGGYCWGPKMYFYQGSQLSVQWTNQHECSGVNNECNIVMQYMCADELRDGVTTDTIPNDEAQYNAQQTAPATFEGLDGQTVYKYGMHESFQYYNDCNDRERNKGLFTADRNVSNNQGASATRQNNNGNRNGFECAEERDYYPYWHPTPWRDIVVLATRTDICKIVQKESQNVKDKNYCSDPTKNNEISCKAANGEWKTEKSWGMAKPDCLQAPFSRDNHLGNVESAPGAPQTFTYNWTIPDAIAHENCAFRVRYNISSFDYDGWFGNVDAGANGELSPVKNDPEVQIFSDNTVTLAMNTNQFGRTFQDRSHTFSIVKRAGDVAQRSFNLNVRGKRGNIVQTYPATEYDYSSPDLMMRVGDTVHIQWTGCNQNPQGNDGEGTRGTDRNNITPMTDRGQNYPAISGFNNVLGLSNAELTDVSFLGQTNCPTNDELLASNNNNQDDADRDPTNCAKLNAANAYYDGGVKKAKSTGVFSFMNSRNNNYTNRSHKGSIHVRPFLPTWAIVVVVVGGALFLASAGVAGAILYGKRNPNSPVNRLAEF